MLPPIANTFLFYNTPLLEEIEKEKDVSAAGFVDDIAILVEGKFMQRKLYSSS